MTEQEVLNNRIIWQRLPRNHRYWQAKLNDEPALLRINNFPDEPLYTFIYFKDVNNFLIFDLDDRPKGWEIKGI